MKVQVVPEAALRDPDSVELARVWIAEEGLHCALKVGMYHKTHEVAEQKAWGTILADMTRHIASALREAYGFDEASSIDAIRTSFVNELKSPTSPRKGSFVSKAN